MRLFPGNNKTYIDFKYKTYEWYKEPLKSTDKGDVLKDNNLAAFLVQNIDKYLKGEYDDILIDDEENRKKSAYQEFLKDSDRLLKSLKGLSIETLAYLYRCYNNKNEFLFYLDNDAYKCRFSENIVNQLKDLGFQYGFENNQ